MNNTEQDKYYRIKAPMPETKRKILPIASLLKSDSSQVDNVIVRYLRKQDPQVVQQVMKKMGWMFRTEPRDACRKKKKSDLVKINDWEIRMLCDMAAHPVL